MKNLNVPILSALLLVVTVFGQLQAQEVGLKAKAFMGATKLKSISLPADTKVIGAKAFDGCQSLQEVVITPAILTAVGGEAFPDQDGLTIYVTNQAQYSLVFGQADFAKTVVKVGQPLSMVGVDQEESFQAQVYSNRLRVRIGQQPALATIYNIHGAKVAQKECQANEQYEIALKAGIYLLQVNHQVVRVLIK